jgi:serpin B
MVRAGRSSWLAFAVFLGLSVGLGFGFLVTAVSDDTSEDIPAIVSGNTAFAFDLYHVLTTLDENVFFSPFGVSAALAMTFAGARAETEAQMADVLHLTVARDEIHRVFGDLVEAAEDAAHPERWYQRARIDLEMANAVWGQEGYRFLDAFLDTLDDAYGARLRCVDFSGDLEGTRRTINEWVSRQTRGRIEDLLALGVLTPFTRLVLTNAVYFLGEWAEAFDPEDTRDGDFHRFDDTAVRAPMMSRVTDFGYAQGDGFQVVELPYWGETLGMVIVLPDSGWFDEIEGALSEPWFADMVVQLETRRVSLWLPKFRVETKYDLAKVLPAMGMPDAFDADAADFSGMDGTRELFIGNVIHQAFVEVGEEGTEAAAATAVVVRATGMPTPPIEFRVDRPFIFAIRDLGTGSVLFLGRITDPS